MTVGPRTCSSEVQAPQTGDAWLDNCVREVGWALANSPALDETKKRICLTKLHDIVHACRAGIGALLVACACVLGAGCKGNATYREGANLTLGLYVPTTDGLVGLQCLDWLSGCQVSMPTNVPFEVVREHVSSNSYLGVVHVNEKTKVTLSSKAR